MSTRPGAAYDPGLEAGDLSRLGVVFMGCLALSGRRAWADTGEISVRCGPEVRRTSAEAAGRDTTAWLGGGGCLLGLGLSPALTATTRYAFGLGGELRVPGDLPKQSQIFHLTRHDLVAGIAWAPSDAVTPVVVASAGATRAAQTGRQWRLDTPDGERRVPPSLEDRTEWHALVRLDALLEWRFRDFWSFSGGLFGEWAEAPGVGALVMLAGYRYL